MITASMLILQGCTEDNIEFDHTIANGQKILKLNAQYYQHSCLEEFTKEINVVFIHGTYVLDGKKGSNFSFSELWNLLQDAEDPLPNNTVIFCTQMITYVRSCLKLSLESQDYQTPKEDHNAQRKVSEMKNLMVEKQRTLPSFALITHFCTRQYHREIYEGLDLQVN